MTVINRKRKMWRRPVSIVLRKSNYSLHISPPYSVNHPPFLKNVYHLTVFYSSIPKPPSRFILFFSHSFLIHCTYIYSRLNRNVSSSPEMTYIVKFSFHYPILFFQAASKIYLYSYNLYLHL